MGIVLAVRSHLVGFLVAELVGAWDLTCEVCNWANVTTSAKSSLKMYIVVVFVAATETVLLRDTVGKCAPWRHIIGVFLSIEKARVP